MKHYTENVVYIVLIVFATVIKLLVYTVYSTQERHNSCDLGNSSGTYSFPVLIII